MTLIFQIQKWSCLDDGFCSKFETLTFLEDYFVFRIRLLLKIPGPMGREKIYT